MGCATTMGDKVDCFHDVVDFSGGELELWNEMNTSMKVMNGMGRTYMCSLATL
jgi:hypothetical protein